MTAPWYAPSGDPATSSSGSSAVIRAEFIAIETAMDKLPPLTANGFYQVNGAGTGTLAITQVTFPDDIDFNNSDPEIRGADTAGTIRLTAGTTNILGGSILLYGDTHATQPDDIEFYGSAALAMQYDDSGGLFDFQANNITTTGLITGGTLKLGPGETITDIEASVTTSADKAVTSGGVKTYVDTQVASGGQSTGKIMFFGLMG